jgi:hypothetical protein
MPILKEEPSQFPETLLEEEHSGDESRRWWVVYTKARQEKSLSREMWISQIPFYLPLVKKTSMVRGRRRNSFVPLFPGYLFLFAAEAERIRCLTTNRVSRMLDVSDPAQLIFDLKQLSRLIASDAPLTLERRLAPGDRVRVKQGSLLGLEGTVLTRRGVTRLLVRVNFLQQGASVEMQDFLLERVE